MVTAGVLTKNLDKIGSNGVTVPQFFYKVVYDPRGQGKMIAFLIPNEISNIPLQQFVVSVDYIETITGIDFFPELQDSVENLLESSKDLSGWYL